MAKKTYYEVTKDDLLKGLRELEKNGELQNSAESVLTQVILNTAKKYESAASNKKTQPINAKDAKDQGLKNDRQNSKLLRQAMLDAGRSIPAGSDAHHIVPANERRAWAKQYADEARAILRRWGIPINHEANGVALPTSSKHPVKELPGAYPHKKVHTKVYYLNIAEQLGEANSRKDCLEMLREIGEDLQDGVYPI